MDERELATQVGLAGGGDRDALQRLIVHYHATLHGRVAADIDAGIGRRLDAADVLQQAYISAFEAIADCQFDGPAGLYKWLERIALNELRNQKRALHQQKRDIRREARAGADTCATYPELVQRLAVTESTPSRHVAREEAVAAVLSSLARLTADQRAVVRLRFLEGQSVPEVAAGLGKTEEAVHALCYRALKALRQSMVSITRYLTRL